MSNFLQVLGSYSVKVLVDATLHDDGFALTVPGLTGKTLVTSPAVTRQILDSPEFDQLFAADKAARILEIVLAQATRPA